MVSFFPYSINVSIIFFSLVVFWLTKWYNKTDPTRRLNPNIMSTRADKYMYSRWRILHWSKAPLSSQLLASIKQSPIHSTVSTKDASKCHSYINVTTRHTKVLFIYTCKFDFSNFGDLDVGVLTLQIPYLRPSKTSTTMLKTIYGGLHQSTTYFLFCIRISTPSLRIISWYSQNLSLDFPDFLCCTDMTVSISQSNQIKFLQL